MSSKIYFHSYILKNQRILIRNNEEYKNNNKIQMYRLCIIQDMLSNNYEFKK